MDVKEVGRERGQEETGEVGRVGGWRESTGGGYIYVRGSERWSTGEIDIRTYGMKRLIAFI